MIHLLKRFSICGNITDTKPFKNISPVSEWVCSLEQRDLGDEMDIHQTQTFLMYRMKSCCNEYSTVQKIKNTIIMQNSLLLIFQCILMKHTIGTNVACIFKHIFNKLYITFFF